MTFSRSNGDGTADVGTVVGADFLPEALALPASPPPPPLGEMSATVSPVSPKIAELIVVLVGGGPGCCRPSMMPADADADVGVC